MKLKTFKKRGKYSVQDIADMFCVTHRTIYNWLKEDADITTYDGKCTVSIVITRGSMNVK